MYHVREIEYLVWLECKGSTYGKVYKYSVRQYVSIVE